jgi:hypothetical protein
MSEAPLAQPWLNFDPAMVLEIAMGADHPHDIAERHGLDVVDFEHMLALPWFNELVARKRQELQDAGQLFQIKAAAMAEALLTRLFQQSMAAAIAAPLQVEVAKQLTDIGRLKPTAAAPLAGPGFQINIQIASPSPDATATSPLVNVTPQSASSSSVSTPTSPGPNVPTRPAPGVAAEILPTVATPTSPIPTSAPPSPAAPPLLTFDHALPPPVYISNLKTPDFDVRHPQTPATGVAGAVPGVGSLAGTTLAQAAARAFDRHAQPVGLPPRLPKG